MLFNIDRTVADLFTSGNPSQRDYAALRYIAMASAEGSHRITGRRKVLDDLAAVNLGDPRWSRAFERAKSRVATEGGLIQKVKTIVSVVVDTSGVPNSVTVGDRRTITIPLIWFDTSAKVQPTQLLAENIDDVRVAILIGKIGPLLPPAHFVPLSVSERHGGGSSISNVLAANACQDKFCLCLADSDRTAPTSALGATAQNLNSYTNESIFPLVEVVITAGRDLENSLPNDFYATEYGGHHRFSSMSHFLLELTNAGEISARSYIDIEKGFTLFDAYGQLPGSEASRFWLAKLPAVLQIVSARPEHSLCIQNASCARGSRRDCQCLLVEGNPSHILRDFYRRYDTANHWQIAHELDVSVRREWESLGVAVMSWCCGDSTIRL